MALHMKIPAGHSIIVDDTLIRFEQTANISIPDAAHVRRFDQHGNLKFESRKPKEQKQ